MGAGLAAVIASRVAVTDPAHPVPGTAVLSRVAFPVTGQEPKMI